jgi:HEAT repeat protein
MLPTRADKSALRPSRPPLEEAMKSIVPLILAILASALPVTGCGMRSANATVSDDVRELIEAAHAAPAALCACAARAVQNSWGWTDAPASPLGRTVRGGRHTRARLSDDDVRFLLASLDTPDPCVRELAVRLVANADREEVVAGLVQRLAAPDSSLRVTAALGLGVNGSARAVEPLLAAMRDDAAGVRANAVWALGRIRDPRAAGPAIAAFADRSPVVREAAAGALGHLEARSATLHLRRGLREDRVAAVRRTAAWALTKIEAEKAIEPMAAVMGKDPDAGVREMCAWALGNLESGRTVTGTLLAVAKQDESAEVREAAVWSIAQHGDASMGKGLGEVLASDRSPGVRKTTAWALGQVGLGAAPPALIDALADRDPGVRLAAAWALGEIEDKSALPALRTALARETHERARKAELRALVRSGEPAERLGELLESQDPELRKAAIRGIAGHHGLDPWPWPQPRPRPFP